MSKSADIPELRLMQCVIINAIYDAIGQNSSGRNASQRSRDRDAAIAWFEVGGADFRYVCQLAGFDPDWLRRTALAFIRSEEKKPRLIRTQKARSRNPTGISAIAARAGVSMSAVRAALIHRQGSKEMQARVKLAREALLEEHKEAA